jgi:hypothetical protein
MATKEATELYGEETIDEQTGRMTNKPLLEVAIMAKHYTTPEEFEAIQSPEEMCQVLKDKYGIEATRLNERDDMDWRYHIQFQDPSELTAYMLTCSDEFRI